MQLSAFLPLVASFLATSITGTSAAALITSAPLTECKSETVSYEGLIGQAKNVQVKTSHCDDVPHVSANGQITSLNRRQSEETTNVCGAQCNTFCFSGANGGPNEGDCQVIADALLFDTENQGPLFNITASGTPTDKVTMQFGSCLTYFLNQDSGNLTYCRPDWSSLVTWLSGDCNAANGAHGGLCVDNDQRWYVQVQNTSG